MTLTQGEYRCGERAMEMNIKFFWYTALQSEMKQGAHLSLKNNKPATL